MSPPNIVHVEENRGDEPAQLIVFRNASQMIVVNVEDPTQR